MTTTAGRSVRAVVYTDLDGTLLDHRNYDWSAATPALARLAAENVPVVPITSKTLAELLPLRARLQLNGPFAVENGGAVCVPAGYFGADAGEPGPDGLSVEILGTHYADIRTRLAALRTAGYAFTGFGDMDSAAVAACTGLAQTEADAACRRLCSEPLIWRDAPETLTPFQRELAAVGLTMRRGGRFIHVLGHADKGQALKRLHRRFTATAPLLAWAIGDSPNDFELLDAADEGVLVARPDGSYAAAEAPPHRARAPGIGPAGWNAAVMHWLEQL